jgi:hypothetical protein
MTFATMRRVFQEVIDDDRTFRTSTELTFPDVLSGFSVVVSRLFD